MISAFFFQSVCVSSLSLMPTPWTVYLSSHQHSSNDATQKSKQQTKKKMWIESNGKKKNASEAQQKNVKHLGDCGITSNSMEFTANLKLECFSNANIGTFIRSVCVCARTSVVPPYGCAWAICATDRNNRSASESNNGTEKLKYVPNEAFSKLNLPKTSRN